MGSVSIFHWLVIIVFFVIYFIPSYIAYKKNHNNKVPILLLNVFLGWTFLGWVAALIWSFYKERV